MESYPARLEALFNAIMTARRGERARVDPAE